MKTYLEIGKITSPHGVVGDVRMEIWADSFSALRKLKRVFFTADGQGETKVMRIREHKNAALVKLDGVSDIDAANALRSKVLYAHRDEIVRAKNAVFIDDLIGITVLDAESSEEYGRISDVLFTGANEVYVVESEGRELLIPAIPDVIISTDITNCIMKIHVLPGLFD